MRIGIVKDRWIEEKLEDKKKINRREEFIETLQAALPEEHAYVPYDFGEDLLKKLRADEIDLVFDLTEGGDVYDEKELSSILSREEIPYIGSNPMAMGMAEDVDLLKAALKRHGIETLNMKSVENVVDLAHLRLTYPVKMAKEGEEGYIVVKDEEALFEAARRIFDKQSKAILWDDIGGDEIVAFVVGNGEDLSVNLRSVYQATLSEEEKHLAKEMSKQVFRLLQLKDYAMIYLEIKSGSVYIARVDAKIKPSASGCPSKQLLRDMIEQAKVREGIEEEEKSRDIDGIIASRKRDIALAKEQSRTNHSPSLDTKEKRKIDDESEIRDKAEAVVPRDQKTVTNKILGGEVDAKGLAQRSNLEETLSEKEALARLEKRYLVLEERVFALENRLRLLEKRG